MRIRDDGGREATARARFVADTSGNRTRISRAVAERVYSRFFQNVALYGYFEGGKRLPAPTEGNILSAAFDEGWFWYIPLSDTLTSVGAVVSREAAASIQSGHAEALAVYISRCPLIAEFLGSATRVREGLYGELRVRKDYSYCNGRFSAPGVLLVGDAACFVDPVFSSGVHLATYGALNAARSINTVLGGDPALGEERCLAEFERRYRREFGKFYQFLLAFYDMHRDETSYFWNARKILNTDERANDAFVRLVSGRSDRDEPLFDDAPAQFFDNRRGFGEWLEANLVEEQRSPTHALDPDRFDPDAFMAGFTREVTQIQLQAHLGGRTPPDCPLFEGGLIPSQDGLAWRLP